MSKRRLTYALLALLVVVGIGLYWVYTTSPARPGTETQPVDPPKKVRIIDGVSVNSVHVLVAEHQGFFEEEGLDAEVSYCAIGKFCMDALNSGGADFAGVVEMNVAQTLFSHDDVAILTEYSEPMEAIKVLGRTDQGVETIDDLRGKRIGVFFGVNIHIFLVELLQEAGIALEEVELVNLSPPDAAAAFISGSIDAVVTWHPIVANIMERVGEQTTILTEDAQRYWPWKLLIVTKRSYLQDHQEEAKRVLRVMVRADKFIEQNPEEVYSIVSAERDLDPEMVPSFLEEISYEIQLTDRLLEMIEYETQWLPQYLPDFYAGKEPVTTDFRSLVAPQLKEVEPEAWEID